MSALPRTCIIGAGSSGIAAAKALHERGLEFDCFERSDEVGGNWVFGNRNGMSAAYRGLFINTSRERMQYSDFPMSEAYPDFPHHTHIREYFNGYVDRFGFRDRIVFKTAVERAERVEDGTWRVLTSAAGAAAGREDGESDGDGTGRVGGEEARIHHYDALLVANGHHWDPRWPEPPFPGSDSFTGLQMHAHSYRDAEFLADRDVVVLGMGNSAMDIAVEASYAARNTYLAGRRGAWVIPKYLRGRPADSRHPVLSNPRVPFRVRQALIGALIKSATGDMRNYGLPAPDHRFGEAHPTVSGRILDRITHGTITPKPNIVALEGDRVRFSDETTVHADCVIYCTGYKISFPFFAPDLIDAPGNQIELFRRVFAPQMPNLFFIGLLQPLGAIMPLAEAQSQWVCDYLCGEYALPSPVELRDDIRRDQAAMRGRYVSSKRHTIQVDFDDYLHALAKERLAGADRARGLGFPLPVPALAGSSAGAGTPAS